MGTFAQAQNSVTEIKVRTISMPVTETMDQTNLREKFPTVTGIYVLKHSRVKRALSFEVKERNPKLV